MNNDRSSKEAALRLRFGDFEFRPQTSELWHRGEPVPLQPQPAKALDLLLRHAGELVSREQLRLHVWGDEIEVDFDQGLNYCLKHIRRVLGDRAETPRFIATVPRRGYRFLAPVDAVAEPRAQRLPIERVRTRPTRWGQALLAMASLVVVLAALRPTGPRLSTTRVAEPQPSRLVVLPFVDLSPAGDAAVLGAGVAQELTTRLARRHGDQLRLIASTSAMTYRGADKSIEQIRDELGVDFVLEGSVRRIGEEVRITAQLIRASDQSHLWANVYDGKLQDLLAWQAEVAVDVAIAAVPSVLPSRAGDASDPSGVPALSPEAFESYLEARYLAEQTTWGAPDPKSLVAARQAFEQTLELDPQAAEPYARLAWVRAQLAGSGADYEDADALARRALELDPEQPQARALLAFSSFSRFEWQAAEDHLLRAIEQEPSLPSAHQLYGLLLSARGRHDAAIAAVERARRLDPTSLSVGSDRALLYFYAGRYREAIRHAQQILDLNPSFPCAYRWIIAAALAEGESELALQSARAEIDALVTSGHSRAPESPIDNLEDYWRWRLHSFHHLPTQPLSPSDAAVSYLHLGDHDQALNSLIEACQGPPSWLLPFLAVDPRFDALRQDPRFSQVLECGGASNKLRA